jgi:outer membrane translocation and assembly module TamA
LVDREVDFAAGKPWSPALEDEVEAAVYALDVFASARAVLPQTPPTGDGPVTLRVEARERAFDELKVGVGFGFQPARWEERISARYLHRNLFGNLTRLDLRAKFGWAQIPTAFNPSATGPLFGISPTFEKKGLLERELRWTLAPSYDLGIEQGYRFHRVRNRVGVSRFFFKRTRAQVAYTLEFFDFFDLGEALDTNRTALGRDFRDPYLLGYVTFDYRIYFTNDILQPTTGVAMGVAWDVAGPVGGDFAFHRVRPEITAYAKPFSWLQLAARAELGYILTPEGGSVPLAMKWYLGGADTVRGWGANRLSPQLSADCDPGAQCKGVPVGGSTMVLANFEARVPIVGPVELAGFVDGGDVQDGERAIVPTEWSYSAGGGLRIATPIGRFRLDAGWRLNDPEKFKDEARWALHLALGEAF